MSRLAWGTYLAYNPRDPCTTLAKGEIALGYPRKLPKIEPRSTATSYIRISACTLCMCATDRVTPPTKTAWIPIVVSNICANRAPVEYTYRLISLSRRFRLSPSLNAAVETPRNTASLMYTRTHSSILSLSLSGIALPRKRTTCQKGCRHGGNLRTSTEQLLPTQLRPNN